MRDPLQVACAVRLALDVVKGRWKPSILYALKESPKRFSELVSELETVSPQALTTQLKELEQDGILARTVFPETPVRVEYRITEFGATLAEVLDELDKWGSAYLDRLSSDDSDEDGQ